MYVLRPLVTKVNKFLLQETFNKPSNVVDESLKTKNWHSFMHQCVLSFRVNRTTWFFVEIHQYKYKYQFERLAQKSMYSYKAVIKYFN